jgi:rhodanese-related sulfurtransferase
VIKLLALLAATFLAAPAFAEEGDCPGDYASHAAHGSALNIPPGLYAHTARRLADFYAATNGARSIYASQIAADIAAAKPQLLLDIRAKVDFDKAHIAGAVNIPLKDLFQPENLVALPTDGTPVVVICYTGHTASMAMGGLVALGYNAYVLRFGMMGWNGPGPQKVGSPSVSQTVYGFGGPTEATPQP